MRRSEIEAVLKSLNQTQAEPERPIPAVRHAKARNEPKFDVRSALYTLLGADYMEVFGEESRSNHKQFLFRRIAWRIQALAEGGLSERARRRALEIANDADLRIRAPRTRFGQDPALDPKLSVTRKVAGDLDARLPPPGSFLEREYKGRRVIVKVLIGGFEFEGQVYRSLSAIATEVTGTKWNGFLFFNLTATEEAPNGQK